MLEGVGKSRFVRDKLGLSISVEINDVHVDSVRVLKKTGGGEVFALSMVHRTLVLYKEKKVFCILYDENSKSRRCN